jgi:hypothetical protein
MEVVESHFGKMGKMGAHIPAMILCTNSSTDVDNTHILVELHVQYNFSMVCLKKTVIINFLVIWTSQEPSRTLKLCFSD